MPRIRGGMGIINPKTNRPGTIGLIATQGASRYLVRLLLKTHNHSNAELGTRSAE